MTLHHRPMDDDIHLHIIGLRHGLVDMTIARIFLYIEIDVFEFELPTGVQMGRYAQKYKSSLLLVNSDHNTNDDLY